MKTRPTMVSLAFFLVYATSAAASAESSPAAAPPPTVCQASGPHHQAHELHAADGTRLVAQSWHPTGPARDVVVIVHGLADYGDLYAPLAEALSAQGYGVYAMDLRGHGHSEGKRAYVDKFAIYTDDVHRFVQLAQGCEGSKPIYMLGHSMGGAIVTLYALEHPGSLAGIILSGPALQPGVDVSGIKIKGAHLVSFLLPSMNIDELNLTKFVHDPQLAQKLEKDPLVTAKVPARTASELLNTMSYIGDHAAELTLPIFIMHGTDDTITNPAGSQMLIERAAATDKTLLPVTGAYHALLLDRTQEVTQQVVNWLAHHS